LGIPFPHYPPREKKKIRKEKGGRRRRKPVQFDRRVVEKMVRLSNFPQDVVDYIAAFLKNWHFARLYATGDARLQRLLENLRCRRCNLVGVARHKSRLIEGFMIGTATSVESELMHVNINLLMQLPPKIRRLAIASPNDKFQIIPNGWDFSWLTTLETLCIGEPYVVRGTITLPTSVTSVSLWAVATSTPINRLEALALLTTLEIVACWDLCDLLPLGIRRVDDLGRFLEHVVWPPSLTSLTFCTPRYLPSFVHLLPSTLTHLEVGASFNDTTVNLAPQLRNFPALTSLVVTWTVVSFLDPLPSSLTRLSVNTLHIPSDRTLLETVGMLPSSVTDFSCKTLEGPIRGSRVALDDFKATFELACPRFTLESIEGLLIHARRTCMPVDIGTIPSLGQVAQRHGLRDDYFSLENRQVFPFIRGRTDLLHMAHILDCAETEEAAVRIIGGRTRYTNDMNDIELDDYPAYVKRWQRLLELGFTSVLEVPSFGLPGMPVLSHQAISNLVRLDLSASSIAVFESIISSNVLSCLEEIRLLAYSWVEGTLLHIYKHRQNMPNLERIVFSSGRSAIDAGVLAALRREMRMSLSPDGCTLVLRVCPRRIHPPPVYVRWLFPPTLAILAYVVFLLYQY
jgi:hypothetical protein